MTPELAIFTQRLAKLPKPFQRDNSPEGMERRRKKLMEAPFKRKSIRIDRELAAQEAIRQASIPAEALDLPEDFMHRVRAQNAVVAALCPGGGITDWTIEERPLQQDRTRYALGVGVTPPDNISEWNWSPTRELKK